ncbi:hypothetical protein C0J52_13905, partial [Blattella germanica]
DLLVVSLLIGKIYVRIKCRKTLHSQTREVVNNVHTFMKSEAASGYLLIPLSKLLYKVPERTIRKIIKEGTQCEEQDTCFGTPGNVHNLPKRDIDIGLL